MPTILAKCDDSIAMLQPFYRPKILQIIGSISGRENGCDYAYSAGQGNKFIIAGNFGEIAIAPIIFGFFNPVC